MTYTLIRTETDRRRPPSLMSYHVEGKKYIVRYVHRVEMVIVRASHLYY